MRRLFFPFLAAGAALALAACASGGGEQVAAPQAAVPDLPALERAYVGQLDRLQPTRDRVSAAIAAYATLKAGIESGLARSPAPNDAALLARWSEAQVALNGADAALQGLSALYAESAATLAQAAAARSADPARAAALTAELRRLLEIVSGDLQRQTALVAGERTALPALAGGIARGAPPPALPGAVALPALPAAQPQGARAPFVTIRFAAPEPDYEDALFLALQQALAQRPDAEFDVVAVMPVSGADPQAREAAQRHALAVMRSMTDMGLQAGRIRLSSVADPQATAQLVLVYLR